MVTQVPMEGHVVREMMIGNTRCKICDDYCRDKTEADVEKILNRIARSALLAFRAEASKDVHNQTERTFDNQ